MQSEQRALKTGLVISSEQHRALRAERKQQKLRERRAVEKIVEVEKRILAVKVAFPVFEAI